MELFTIIIELEEELTFPFSGVGIGPIFSLLRKFWGFVLDVFVGKNPDKVDLALELLLQLSFTTLCHEPSVRLAKIKIPMEKLQ